MSASTFFSICCDDCGAVAGGADDMRDTVKAARRHVRASYGWVRRPDPDDGKPRDLCPRCQAHPRYHRASTMNIPAQRQLFDQQVADYANNRAASQYWAYLRELFDKGVADGRPQPFSHYAPMFAEEFTP